MIERTAPVGPLQHREGDFDARSESAAGRQHQMTVTVIEPVRGWQLPPVKELWRYRDLLYQMLRRDVKTRYHQTVVGAGWAVVQPVLMAAVFSVFLGRLAKVPSEDNVPYPVFALCGTVIWFFFYNSISKSSESTVTNALLISKIYFPRIVIPVATGLVSLVDLTVAAIVLIVVMAAYGTHPSVHLTLAPLIVAVAIMISLGAGMWLSAFAARYRDVKLLVPFALYVMMFVTPVVYPLKLVPAHLRDIYALNPVVGVLEGWRYALLPHAGSPGLPLIISIVAGLALMITGIAYFTRAEHGFADVI